MSHFKIEKLNYKQDWSELQDFFKKVYSPNHILVNQEFFEWQFVTPGFQNWLVKKDGEIISHTGIINPAFMINGRKVNVGFWSCLISDPEYRNTGLSLFLNRAIGEEMDVFYSTGINNQGVKLFTELGWTHVGNLYRWLIKQPRVVYPNYTIEINKFDEKWDSSWEALVQRFPVATYRRSKYLNWRFVNHLLINYKIFGVVADKGYDGYIVLRLEEGEIRAVRIVDFIAKNEETEQKLLKAALNFSSENKVDFLDFFCSSKMYAKSLKDLGFNDSDNETPVFILPIDNTRKNINWAYKVINQRINIKPEDWFIVKADGDKDRP